MRAAIDERETDGGHVREEIEGEKSCGGSQAAMTAESREGGGAISIASPYRPPWQVNNTEAGPSNS